MSIHALARISMAFLLALAGAACGGDATTRGDGHGETHGDEAEFARGPNGGRLLEDGDFALEIALYEAGGTAEMRAWGTRRGAAIPPDEIDLTVGLARFGGRVERVAFAPAGAFLRGDRTIAEPHSFDVTVAARHGGEEHRFAYASYEGRVEVAAEAARATGIRVETAGPARIAETVVLHGRVEPDGDRTAQVTPRFPGIAVEVCKQLGDAVARDEVVAVVESNESLRPYEVRSRLAGTAIAKAIVPGEFVASDAAIYVVSDLSRVWVDLQAHRLDFERLRVGQRVEVDDAAGGPPIEARITYLSPLGAPDSQSLLARVVVENADHRLRPGLFVTARVTVAEIEAPVAVRSEALQRLRDWDVVFRAAGDTYEAQPVELGARDAAWVEIRSGLAAGDAYVAEGSFVLKADVGKSGASHDH
jgi:cobalt-zinc-cadmium efflux system membrane fusion protein